MIGDELMSMSKDGDLETFLGLVKVGTGSSMGGEGSRIGEARGTGAASIVLGLVVSEALGALGAAANFGDTGEFGTPPVLGSPAGSEASVTTLFSGFSVTGSSSGPAVTTVSFMRSGTLASGAVSGTSTTGSGDTGETRETAGEGARCIAGESALSAAVTGDLLFGLSM